MENSHNNVSFFYSLWTLGRPDMALFKFVSGILNNKPIDIYNNGEMYRDFTYIDDLVHGIRLLIDAIPSTEESSNDMNSSSPVAPYRVVNIGNSNKIKLLDFIEAIEKNLNKKAIRNYLPMQTGDVPSTWADTSILNNLINYKPQTNFREGVDKFIKWYREYYND